MNKLLDNEILALDKVLVRGNVKLKSVVCEIGTQGEGKSNTSNYHSDGQSTYTLAELDGRRICLANPFECYNCRCANEIGIAAVVDDLVYLIIEDYCSRERKVITVKAGESFTERLGIGYDTCGIYSIIPQE